MHTPSPQHALLLTYYSDDFTGATDALECLALAGLRTRLFLQPPTRADLAAVPRLDAIGVAGRTRSLPTAEVAAEARSALTRLRELNPRHVHYKVCSTFDSSPAVGSIGRVIDEGTALFPGPFVPLVVGAPPLGRWCVFGNLFAQLAIGGEGEVCRLDRHPTMRHHPTTPADESDVRVHLARQTDKSIALFDIRQIDLPLDQAAAALKRLLDGKPQVVLFDVLHLGHLAKIGSLLESSAQEAAPLFSVGSSAVEMALTAHWAELGQLPPTKRWDNIAGHAPVLVISGSCSPVTAAQIDCALASGFGDVPIDTARLLQGADMEQVIAPCCREAVSQLAAGRSVVVHTSRGPNDPRLAPLSRGPQCRAAELLGTALGRVLAACLEKGLLRRACLAGGDTSSFAARELGIESVEMIAPFARGAPLCRLTSPRPEVDGLEAVFKAGQVGGPDLLVKLVAGAA